MRIDVFCESGKEYGLGHLRRCENLVGHIQSVFSSVEFEIFFHSDFFVPQEEIDIAIIDSYITPLSFYESIKAKLLICLDDFHRLTYPKNALLLSPTLGKRRDAYSGEDYILLNPIFTRPKTLKEQKGRILINLGGSEQNTLLSHIISSLQGEIRVINPYFKSSHCITLHSLSSQQICDEIDKAEVVICAGGGGLNEALARGKKIIALCIASNQISQLTHAHFLPSLFTIFSFKNLHSKLRHALKVLCSLPAPSPRALGYSLAPLLYKRLLPFFSPSNALHFLELTHVQKLEVLTLRNQQEVRENSLNSQIITHKEHFDFIASLSPNQFFWAFFEDENKRGEIIAVGSLTLEEESKATLGIYKNMRYKNIGENILHSLILSAKKLNINTLELEVLKSNERAIWLYEKLGFEKTQESERSIKMEKKL